ncbi:MAG TPA: CapA family protein, partial [Polyangiaceae bacterium]|nr:CapA family protein [Polyangiaceae bacterium]
TGGFDLVGLANNHAFDRGSLGYRDTVARLDEVGLAHVGHPSLEGEDPVHRVVLGGVRMALVAHHNRPTELAIDDVRRARRGADVVIVFEHWGVDYAFEPVAFQRHRAGQLARAGAHAIVGSHPHVVHPEAFAGGTLVAYSLGNFVFPAMNEPGTHLGALLELDLLPRGIVGHRYRAVHLDEQGLPRIAEETTELPTLPERPVPRLPLATIGTGSNQ